MCRCAVINKSKADQGHKKGHVPRALHEALINGHLKAAKKGAKYEHRPTILSLLCSVFRSSVANSLRP
jgi:hypothetical protein